MRTSIALGVASLAAVLAGVPIKAVADAPPEYSVTDLGTLPGGHDSGAAAINNDGQIVGEVSISANTGGYYAFLYSNGGMTNLGEGHAAGVNASGQAVGTSNGESERDSPDIGKCSRRVRASCQTEWRE